MEIQKITSQSNQLIHKMNCYKYNLHQQHYFQVIHNIKCHFYHLLFTTDLLKRNYSKNYHNKNNVRLLNQLLPEDISIMILSYVDSPQELIYNNLIYNNLIYNNTYYNRFIHKWYITISNVLYLFEESYHSEILYISTIHKVYYDRYFYSDYLFEIEFNEFYKLIVLESLTTTRDYLFTIMKEFMYKLIFY